MTALWSDAGGRLEAQWRHTIDSMDYNQLIQRKDVFYKTILQ